MRSRGASSSVRAEPLTAAAGVGALALLGALFVFEVRSSNAPGERSSPAAAAPLSASAVENRALPDEPPLRYGLEWPAIGYSSAARRDPVAVLAARIASGAATLEHDPVRGYLDSLLDALAIDPSSQVLVFSQTSLQSRRIRPATPRAIYFNDSVYVAWVQSGPLEIVSLDPDLGAVFYLVEQEPQARPAHRREFTRCLSCHDSHSLTGGGVPRLIVGSGYTGPAGELITHEGWILVTDRTPLASRWGGWYVTGRHGDQVHLGNMVIRSFAEFARLEDLRIGNIDTVDHLFDTGPYLRNTSDVVALTVLEHQAYVQNLITRLNYVARQALHDDGSAAAVRARIAGPVEDLVRALLFSGEAKLTAPLDGDPAFAAQFQSRAVRDEQGRSLRDFDMRRRMFRYPLSYLIYSPELGGLPDAAKQALYERLAAVLTGADTSAEFAHLTAEDRANVRAILAATKPDLAAVIGG
jgi:hypothetical protein